MNLEQEERILLMHTENTWHRHFAHMGGRSFQELVADKAVVGLRMNNKRMGDCKPRALDKISRAPHPPRRYESNPQSVVLHFDTWGPACIESLAWLKYYLLATDEFSGYKYIRFAKNKADIKTYIREIIKTCSMETPRHVDATVADNRTEFMKEGLAKFLDERNIVRIYSAPYTPEQNDLAERGNRVVLAGIRTLLTESNLPLFLWAEDAAAVIYVHNRLPPTNETRTRYELHLGLVPKISNLRISGRAAVIVDQSPATSGVQKLRL